MDITREIQTAIRTGRVVLGSNATRAAIINGEAKLVIVASNAPREIRRDIERYAKLAGIPVYEFPGTSWDLGAVCNKPFMVAAMAIIDPGESSILEVVKG